jgi:hypothetical protein
MCLELAGASRLATKWPTTTAAQFDIARPKRFLDTDTR